MGVALCHLGGLVTQHFADGEKACIIHSKVGLPLCGADHGSVTSQSQQLAAQSPMVCEGREADLHSRYLGKSDRSRS